MELSEGIRKIGFRRWYERQLIEGHLYLISGILCLFTSMACLEGFGLRIPAWEYLLRLSAAIAGAAFCLWTLRRYLMMLGSAEHAAERSVCEKCGIYRGLTLSGKSSHATEIMNGDEIAPVGVRCRQCGHEWTIK